MREPMTTQLRVSRFISVHPRQASNLVNPNMYYAQHSLPPTLSVQIRRTTFRIDFHIW